MENGNNLIHSFADSEHCPGNFKGLNKREHFAILALQGITSNHGVRTDTSDFAKVAVKLADELLKQLENPNE